MTTATTPKKRRRRLRWLVGLGVVLILLVAALPILASIFAPPILVRELEKRIHGTARMSDLTVGYRGDVTIDGLAIDDAGGQPVLSIDQAQADIDLVNAVRGSYRATASVDGLTLHVRRTAGGGWNLTELPRETKKEGVDAPKSTKPTELPDIQADVSMKSGRVIVHGDGGATELSAMTFHLRIDDAKQPATFRFGSDVVGPNGRSGRIDVSGQVDAFGGDTPTANVELTIDSLLLDAFVPALRTVVAGLELSGRVDGTTTLALDAGYRVRGHADVTARDIEVPPLRAGGPSIRIAAVTVKGDAQADENGTGHQSLRFAMDEFFSVAYDGDLDASNHDAVSLNGRVKVEGQISRLAELAQALTPVKQDLRFDGALDGDFGFAVAANMNTTSVEQASLDGNASIRGLAATDAAGAPIDLGELEKLDFAVKASTDLRSGSISVPTFVAELGPIRASGRVEARRSTDPAGVPVTVDDSRVELHADLDRTRALLARVVDLGDLVLTGTIDLTADARQDGDKVKVDADLTPRRVRVNDLALAGEPIHAELLLTPDPERLAASGRIGGKDVELVLDGEKTIRQTNWSLDFDVVQPAPTDVTLNSVRYRSDTAEAGLTGTFSGIDDPMNGSGRVEVDVRAALEHVARDVTGFGLEAYQGRGQVATTMTVAMDGKKVDVDAKTTFDQLSLTVPAAEPDTKPTSITAPRMAVALTASAASPAGPIDPATLKVDARGRVSGASVAVDLAGGKSVRQSNWSLDFDVAQPSKSDVTVNSLRYRSDTAEADVAGSFSGIEDPMNGAGRFQVDVRTAVEKLLRDVSGFGLDAYQGKGRVVTSMTIDAKDQSATLDAKTTVEQLSLTVLATEPGATPLVLNEPKATVDLSAAIAAAAGTVDLKKLLLDAAILRGNLEGRLSGLPTAARPEGTPLPPLIVEGLKGEFFYVPDRIAAFLGPRLPGRLYGSEEQRIDVDWSGRFEDLELATILVGSNGTLNAGIGHFAVPGLETAGTFNLGLTKGLASLKGDLGANGGTLDLIGDLGLSEDPSAQKDATLQLRVDDFHANTKLSDLLTLVHPIFAAQGTSAGEIGGLLNVEIDLSYLGGLSLEQLTGDLTKLDPRKVKGRGQFKIDEAVVKGSPLLGKLLSELGLESDGELNIEPITFEIDGGRLFYAEPWGWNIRGIETEFTGSVGLDKTLDLALNVPINNKLIKKYSFLESLKGGTLKIPLRGTAMSPSIDIPAAIQGLAGDAAKQAIKDKIGEKTGGLGGVLGGTDPDTPAQTPAEALQSAADLLKEADALWNQGEKKKAAKIYRRIEKEYKLTPTYLLNKSRIEERGEKPEKNKNL